MDKGQQLQSLVAEMEGEKGSAIFSNPPDTKHTASNSAWKARNDYMGMTYLKVMRFVSKKKPWWHQGIGDLDLGREVRDKVCKGIQAYDMVEVGELNPLSEDQPHILVGNYESPIASQLPEESRSGSFRLVLPQDGSEPKGVVVVASMSMDLGFSHRFKQVALPLSKQGLAVILPSFAYTGARMPKGQHKGYHRTLLDTYMFIGNEIVETNGLARWGRQRYPGIPVILAGTSAGGLAVQLAGAMQDDLIGVVSVAAMSDSKAAAESWMFRYTIDMDKVGHNGNLSKEADEFLTDACFEYFRRRFIENGLIDLENPRENLVYNIVSLKNDTVCTPQAAKHTFQLLASCVKHSKLTWLGGGHVYAMQHQELMVPYVLETINVLNKLSTASK